MKEIGEVRGRGGEGSKRVGKKRKREDKGGHEGREGDLLSYEGGD